MLTFSPILAQKVDFISKREQNQDSFFPGDILKIYIIGLNLKRKSSQNFPHGQDLYSSKLKAKNFCFLKRKAIKQTASKTMMKTNSHTQLGAMPSQLTFQQHKILCVNYRLPSKYKTKWPKPGEKDLLTMLG